MWLSCHTQEEIAEVAGCDQKTVANEIDGFRNSVLQNQIPKTTALINHADDFEPQLYNIWRKTTKTNSVEHFGNSEVTWVDNLLYRFTQPFDRA